MNIFKKNLDVLALKEPAFAERLRSADIEPVNIETTKTGDRTFCYGGRYFHSRYDPAREAALQADEILSREPDWVVLFGLGCGYLPARLAECGKVKLIIHEPSLEILKGVLRCVDLTSLLRKPDIYIVTDAGAVAGLVRGVVDGMDGILAYQTPPYSQSFPDQLAEHTQKVKNAHTTNKAGISTEVTSSLKWVDNYFANIKSFFKYPPVDTLKGRFNGVPLVIAGAGPSLGLNAHVLKEFRDRIFVIAAITAFKPLLKHGVVPDLVIAAEKKDLPEFFTNGQDDLKTRFLLAEVTNDKMFERETGGKFVYYNPYSSLSVEQARFWGAGFFPANGGSVTTVALDIGRMLGCSPVIFIGQDLAYGDGKTHADESFYQDTRVTIDPDKKVILEGNGGQSAGDVKELHWLKGLDGKPIPSRYDWVTFHQWFEKEMANIRASGSELLVINATEGGAFIEGMVHQTLRSALEGCAAGAVDAGRIMRQAESGRPPVDTDALDSSFRSILEGLTEIRRLSQSIVRTARAMKKKLKGGLSPILTSRIEKIKRLEEKLFAEADRSPFIWETLSAYTYSLKEYLREDEEGTTEEQFERNLLAIIDSYGRFEEMADRFIPALQNAIEIVKDEAASATELSA